jgi:glycosyltransferase involved in cell wall biosynthesis
VPGISVIICSRNPRPAYFRRVLKSLEEQTFGKAKWELLVVDNGSANVLADTWDLSWHPRHVHIREDELGLTSARLRGINESTGSLVLFVDDDNVLPPDYLESVARIGCARPRMGAFGAAVLEPEFEIEPRPDIRPLLKLMAIRAESTARWTGDARNIACRPWGAGLCVTRPVATAYVDMVRRLQIAPVLDRCGSRLFAGGDDLFSVVAAFSGLEFGVFPELRLVHLIHRDRLQDEYLLRLIHDHTYSHAVLNYLLFGTEQRTLSARAIARIALHGIRRGRFSMRCQWAAAQGGARAARFLAEAALRPIERARLSEYLECVLIIATAWAQIVT